MSLRSALSRSSAIGSSSICLPRAAAPLSVRVVAPRINHFATSALARKDPSENRRNSEGTMPGAGSTDEIADSEGAYSASKTRPDQAGAQISSEKPGVEMESSAASNDNAARPASEGNKETTSSRNGTNPPPSRENLGGLKGRKKQGQA